MSYSNSKSKEFEQKHFTLPVKFNFDDDVPTNLPNHFFTNKEIEDLINTDFCSKIDQNLREEKVNLIKKIKKDLIEYVTSDPHTQKIQTDDDASAPTIQDTSNIDVQPEKEEFIEEEEEFINDYSYQDNNVHSLHEEEEEFREYQDHSEKVPSEIFNNFVEEEDLNSKFNFENNSQNFPPDDLSQIEKVENYGSIASDSQMKNEEELHSINFISGNDDEQINLSPIGDNQPINNHSAEVSSASYISGDNANNNDFEVDAIIDEFGD